MRYNQSRVEAFGVDESMKIISSAEHNEQGLIKFLRHDKVEPGKNTERRQSDSSMTEMRWIALKKHKFPL